MKKLISVLFAVLIISVASAQEPWQHPVQPAFPEPFDFVLVPWDEPAQPRDMSACWHEGQDVPFLGAGFRYLCFKLPADVNVNQVTVAMKDAGYVQWGSMDLPFMEPPMFSRWDSYQRKSEFQSVQAWYFHHPDGTYVSFGYSPAE